MPYNVLRQRGLDLYPTLVQMIHTNENVQGIVGTAMAEQHNTQAHFLDLAVIATKLSDWAVVLIKMDSYWPRHTGMYMISHLNAQGDSILNFPGSWCNLTPQQAAQGSSTFMKRTGNTFMQQDVRQGRFGSKWTNHRVSSTFWRVRINVKSKEPSYRG